MRGNSGNLRSKLKVCKVRGAVYPVCDFCSNKLPIWLYPTRDFEVPRDSTAGSEGAWLACDSCHAAIEANDQDALAAHALAVPIVKKIVRSAGADRVLQRLRELYAKFHAQRTGPCVRLAGGKVQ